jgi:hypothetical protein
VYFRQLHRKRIILKDFIYIYYVNSNKLNGINVPYLSSIISQNIAVNFLHLVRPTHTHIVWEDNT